MIFRRNGEMYLFNKKRQIEDLKEEVRILKRDISYLIERVEELQKGHGEIPSIYACKYIKHNSRNITTNIYFDEGLSNGGVISQDEYEDKKYNMGIDDVTFHELAQYVLAGTPIHRDRKTIVADPSGNTQFHKSNILCNESEASDGLSDKSSEK